MLDLLLQVCLFGLLVFRSPVNLCGVKVSPFAVRSLVHVPILGSRSTRTFHQFLFLLKSRRKGFLCWHLFLNPAAIGQEILAASPWQHQFTLVLDSAPELPAVDLVFLVSLPDFALSDSRPFSFSYAAQFPAQPIDFLPVCSVLREAQRFPARFSSVRPFPTRCLVPHGLDSAGARPVSPQSWPHF
jgi:hypothetical protein